VPWQEGHSITWDVTIADTVVGAYLTNTSATAGAEAEAAAERKTAKYTALLHQYLFSPVVIETFGPICNEVQGFLRSIDRHTTLITSDPRESAFLFQRLSLAVHRFSSVCFTGTFSETKTSHA
jgi:hypothetical protein